MKKFTFLLTLLLAVTGTTAFAQTSLSWKRYVLSGDAVTDLSNLQDGGTYAFKSVGKSKFVKIEDNSFDSKHITNIANLSADDENSGLAVFTFHKKDGENTYSFESAWSGYYISPVVDGACYLGQTEASFVIKTTNVEGTSSSAGNFCLKNADNDVWFDMQDGQFVGWQGKGANCWYQIIPVTVSSDVVTYYKTTSNVTFEGNAVANASSWYKDGATFSSPFTDNNTKSYFYSITPSFTNTTVSASNTSFDYTATITDNIPVDFDKVYTLRTRIGNSDLKDIRFVKADSYSNAEIVKANASFSSVSSYSDFRNGLWKFVKSGLGVKIYNVGTGKYLNGNSPATLDANGKEFYFHKPTKENAQFLLCGGNSNAYLGNHSCAGTDGDYNDRLGVWTASGASTDEGSNFTIEDVEASTELMSMAKDALTKSLTITEANSNSYLIYDLSTINTAKNNISAANTLSELDAIYDGINIFATPDESVYYRIKSVAASDGNAYLTTDEMFVGKGGTLNESYNDNNAYDGKKLNRTITRSSASAQFGPQIWKFVKTAENSYQVKNVNTMCNSAFFTNNNLDMPVNETYGQSISLKAVLPNSGSSDNSILQIILNGNTPIGIRGDKYYGQNSDLKNANSQLWQVEKVNIVPVAISDANYASVAFPFATQVPDDVKAFYATHAENGKITLVEIADGIIPANTGAIIYHDGKTTANLTVTTTDNTLVGNILNPTTAKRAGFTAETTYVLAKNSENNAAFLKSTLTTVPANKAYINADEIPADASASNVLNFNFGETTGIQSATTSDNNTEYYDLQGRRVLYPTHGIFVTAKGQKILIK